MRACMYVGGVWQQLSDVEEHGAARVSESGRVVELINRDRVSESYPVILTRDEMARLVVLWLTALGVVEVEPEPDDVDAEPAWIRLELARFARAVELWLQRGTPLAPVTIGRCRQHIRRLGQVLIDTPEAAMGMAVEIGVVALLMYEAARQEVSDAICRDGE